MAEKEKDDQWTIKNNGKKDRDHTSILTIVALVAIIAGVYAMVEPMGQRVDFIEKELSGIRADTASKRDHGLLNERLGQIEEWRVWWNREMLPDQVQMSEKIKQLERQIYGSVSPQISGE